MNWSALRPVDAHTHLHPPRLFAAIRRWFDDNSHWKLREPTEPEAVAAFLQAQGVERFVFFSYAHKGGMARDLNRWLAETGRRVPMGIPLGTVHPDDPDVLDILDEALVRYEFRGIKLHIQVQRFYPDDPRMWPVYERLAELSRVLVIHTGNAPHLNEFVGMARFERALERVPTLRAQVCHMGANETDRCFLLMERFPGLHLDTTMAMTRASIPYTLIDPATVPNDRLIRWQDRVIYGSDYPNLPYPYEEERRDLLERELPERVLVKLFRENAVRLYGL